MLIKDYIWGQIIRIPGNVLVVTLIISLLLSYVFIGYIGYHGIKKGIRISALFCLIVYTSLIFGSTVIFRETMVFRVILLVPFSSYFVPSTVDPFAVEENIMNIIIFIPIGFFAKTSFPSWSCEKVLLFAVVVSCLIEVTQFVFKKGFAEIDDLIHNTLGCFIGFGLSLLVREVWFMVKNRKRM